MPKRAAWSRSIVERQHAAAGLLVRGHVAQHAAASAAAPSSFGAQSFSSSMSESCSVYWYCVRVGAAADVQVLRRLQEQRRARHLRELRPQPGDDLVGAGAALVARLQADDHEAVVDRPAAAEAGALALRRPDPAATMSGAACCRRTISSNEMSCGASESPMMIPVSCCGKKPFGIIDVQQHGERDRDAGTPPASRAGGAARSRGPRV